MKWGLSIRVCCCIRRCAGCHGAKVLSHVYDLKLRQFSTEHDIPHKEQINEDSWWANIAYLTDIFSHLNELNTKMKGKNENILTATDKLYSFKAKLKLWQKNTEK